MHRIAIIEEDEVDAAIMASDLHSTGTVIRYGALWDGLAAMVDDPPDAIVLAGESVSPDALSLVTGMLRGVPVIVCAMDASEEAAAQTARAGGVAHVSKYALGSRVLAESLAPYLPVAQRLAA